jgi:hypothetical protein
MGLAANPPQSALNAGQPVSSWPHTYTAVNSHNVNVQHGGSAASDGLPSLFSTMSAGLAPTVPGQVGPTLEQLLDRRSREWKAYHNASEFKEALEDWYTSVQRLYPSSLRHHTAAHKYVLETCSLMEKVGWQKAYEYHKAAFKAGKADPPIYDPLTSGPIYHFGYITLIQPHLPAAAKPFANKSGTNNKARGSQQSTGGGTKRSFASAPCSIHTNSNHTNAQCNSQQGNKRRTPGGSNSSRPTTGDSDA